jgi:Bacterial PH domain
MDSITPNPLESHLGPGERLLWSGRPRQGIILRLSDAYVIPFSILWAGFAVFWESSVIMSGAPLLFTLWGIPFVLMGAYITVGRFLLDMRTRAKTFYGVTNVRILIVSGAFTPTIKSLNLRTLADISLEQRGNGIGTITFGRGAPFGSLARGIWWPGMDAQLAPAFDQIANAQHVYTLIQSAQQQAYSGDQRA